MKAVFRNGSYCGDILHAYSNKADAEITISSASYAGRISTSVSSHPNGMPRSKEQYALIGRVDHVVCPRDTDFGLKVKLEAGACWTVTAPSYLTELTVGPGCAVKGNLTVDGEPAEIQEGTYTGTLILSPV